MKNIRNIQPVEMLAYMGSAMRQAEYIKFVSFSGYNFSDDPGHVKYEIYAVNRPLTDLGQPLEYHELLTVGEVPLPKELVEQWSTDDEIIFDYVLNILGFEKLN
jgi:hypothetical protein